MWRLPSSAVWRALLVVLLLVAARARAEDEPRRVPLLFHVAQVDGKPVADASFLRVQLELANAIYRPLGLELTVVGERKLATKHARLISRADRDALKTQLQPGVINCFIVATLMDVDEPGRERRGVHWRARNAAGKHYVVVSAISFPAVLAHELGHFFGNQQHSDVVGNLMSYQHTDALPVLDDAQQRRVRDTVDGYFASGELLGVKRTRADSTAKRRRE